jgi:hypothetical protein
LSQSIYSLVRRVSFASLLFPSDGLTHAKCPVGLSGHG